MIPMRDGVKLFTVIMSPVGNTKPLPVLITRTPYGADIPVSEDGTIKTRFKTFDNHAVEGVLIPTEERKTACVSSQIGCSLSCKFWN